MCALLPITAASLSSDRAARIRQAAVLHDWLRSPERILSAVACSRCDTTLSGPSAALPVHPSRGLCKSHTHSTTPDIVGRRSIVDALGLLMPRRTTRARGVPLFADRELTPYRSVDTAFVCDCGWRPPRGSRRTSTLVVAHLRALGCPRPRPKAGLIPHARKFGIYVRRTSIAGQWADWVEVAPDYAHRWRALTRTAPLSAQSKLQHHCSACQDWMPAHRFRLRPCYVAAGYLSGDCLVYQALLPDWSLALRHLWRTARDAGLIRTRFVQSDI